MLRIQSSADNPGKAKRLMTYLGRSLSVLPGLPLEGDGSALLGDGALLVLERGAGGARGDLDGLVEAGDEGPGQGEQGRMGRRVQGEIEREAEEAEAG